MGRWGRFAVVVVLVATAANVACSAQQAALGSLGTPAELATWIAEHPANAALVAHGPHGSLDVGPADERFVLASVIKVLVLATYAEQVATGTLRADERVPVRTIERWYWPNTDGGAHRRALADLRGRGRVEGEGDLASVTLDDVAWSMIRWSDNAATDHLLGAVGGPSAVAAMAARLGMQRQEPPVHTFGAFVAWTKDPLAELLARSPAERSEHSVRLAERTTVASVLDAGGFGDQRARARTFPGGTASEWVALFETLADGTALGPAATDVVRRHLEWPMTAFPSNAARFLRYATKGGDLPGILTEVSTIEPRGASGPTTAAVFFRDLPADVERSLKRSFVHQQLLVALAEDAELFAEISRRG